jgi:hypothetical protein
MALQEHLNIQSKNHEANLSYTVGNENRRPDDTGASPVMLDMLREMIKCKVLTECRKSHRYVFPVIRLFAICLRAPC